MNPVLFADEPGINIYCLGIKSDLTPFLYVFAEDKEKVENFMNLFSPEYEIECITLFRKAKGVNYKKRD